MRNPEKSLLISWIVTVFVVVVIIFSLCFCWYQPGTFIVLSFTLLAVVWYTYFTHQLAMKKEEPAVGATIHYIPEARDIRVLLQNLTNRYAATRVWVEVKVYGKTTSLGPDYSGETVWHLTPQFLIDGHFPLKKPLQQVGKNFDAMVMEANDENITRQLRLSLKVRWTDEEGRAGEYPEHLWYFDFRRDGFVYQVGGFKD